MAFNPSFSDITTAYKNGQKVKTDSNESGKYNEYTECVEVTGMVGQQIDGKFGGYGFKSNDGSVIARTKDGVRGIDFPATLLVTSDGVALVFY